MHYTHTCVAQGIQYLLNNIAKEIHHGTFCLLPPPPPPHRNPRNPISASRRSGSTRTHKQQSTGPGLPKSSKRQASSLLLKLTGVANHLYGQLNNSYNIITIFAPSDSSFSSLKAGTLNTLTDEQQVELVQFHVIPSYVSSSNFQTISNPLRTQAGDSAEGHFPLNITTSGNTVNITSEWFTSCIASCNLTKLRKKKEETAAEIRSQEVRARIKALTEYIEGDFELEEELGRLRDREISLDLDYGLASVLDPSFSRHELPEKHIYVFKMDYRKVWNRD
ncbi:hypothetical protein HID58_045821 [Brassica napus]|uniref:FAS1 domain-containing protein n=1 Tax=Brassica napus TaxID=3708 RepID=A0ABQ8AUV3_BRANA|nr:hypothetical protein HID58_045821 [Brassica napus]